jgi:hypothetical protein
MTNYEKLQNLLNEKQTVSGLRKRKVRVSIDDLLNRGTTRTGESYYNYGGGATKNIWTNDVHMILDGLGIAHECGNNAPRGGANGEYVKITSPAFLKTVKQVQAELRAKAEADRKVAEEKAARKEKARAEHAKRMNELVEKNLDTFMNYHLVPLHSGLYYNMYTKNEKKTIAREISEETGMDYQLCLWFVRSNHFENLIEDAHKKVV